MHALWNAITFVNLLCCKRLQRQPCRGPTQGGSLAHSPAYGGCRTGASFRNHPGADQGSMSAGRVARRSPLLGGLHRVMDGTMLGVLAAVAVLAGLTASCNIAGRCPSTVLRDPVPLPSLDRNPALMERHLLRVSQRPSQLVPTKVENLVCLKRPSASVEPVETAAVLPSLDELIVKRIRPAIDELPVVHPKTVVGEPRPCRVLSPSRRFPRNDSGGCFSS